MLRVKVREAMQDYRRRTGERMTYDLLAKLTGLARPTIESLASRDNYNTRLSTIEKICRVLGCQPGDLLELTPPESTRSEN
ncbi:helix-turn-helix transcriptional regulator [Verrucomicrobium sp. 3C]|uniref:helix-turn-helix domain-containing protein n=1 Tax=Verrucomicrobium sp. 3C TaxID=1134055 RepID=UPI000362EB48|nr:helix-turn-helix transcriptional regulator [Verrucomicrobium sp. 3C]